MKILVTDGNNRATLAITRSLGKQGHTVIVGEKYPSSLASASKYCMQALIYPDPVNAAEQFVDSIFAYIQDHHIDVVLPVSDVTTFLIAKHAERLPESCHFPFTDYKTLKQAADKNYITHTAKQLGVPIPQTLEINSKHHISDIPDKLAYPVVLKPACSRVQTAHGWKFTSVSYANDHTQLVNMLNDKDELEFPVLLQERIIGPGVGVFLCCNKGEVIAAFSHQRLREKPPSGGVSVLRKSIPVDSDAFEHAKKLLAHLNWHGVAMVEFKKDNRDQTLRLMEINGRFWGSLQLAIDAGVNFPALLLDTLQPENIKPVFDYKLGVQTRWFWGDVDALLMRLLKPKAELKLPPHADGRLKSILKFMKLWGKGLHYEVLSLDDIKPWLFETYSWFFRR